jgi:hypothetical protein
MSAPALTVRRFSAAGPCISLGRLLRETAKFYVYQPRRPDESERRVAKDRYGLVHTEPCNACRDHARTQYPEGYMD